MISTHTYTLQVLKPAAPSFIRDKRDSVTNSFNEFQLTDHKDLGLAEHIFIP
jgi:hypothetical protein